MAATVAINAQEYNPIKVGIAVGYASPSDGGGGILFDLEPAYRLKDEIAIGFRFEAAAMARAIGGVETSVSGNTSFTLNGIYYLMNDGFRPYVGLGLGLYNLAAASVAGAAAASTSKLGFYPRIGIDINHFNINIDYNIIPATKPDVVIGSFPDIKNSYLGLRIGAFISGGKK